MSSVAQHQLLREELQSVIRSLRSDLENLSSHHQRTSSQNWRGELSSSPAAALNVSLDDGRQSEAQATLQVCADFIEGREADEAAVLEQLSTLFGAPTHSMLPFGSNVRGDEMYGEANGIDSPIEVVSSSHVSRFRGQNRALTIFGSLLNSL